MKKVIAIILALILTVSIIACNKDERDSSDQNDDEYYFTAKVVEANDSTLLLEVTDVGHSGLSVGALASISIKDSYPECKADDTVKIVFDGTIQETYPCQLPNIHSLTKIN